MEEEENIEGMHRGEFCLFFPCFWAMEREKKRKVGRRGSFLEDRTKTPRIGSDYKMLNGIVVDLVTHLNFIRAGNWLRSKRSWKNRLGQRKVAITPCLLLWSFIPFCRPCPVIIAWIFVLFSSLSLSLFVNFVGFVQSFLKFHSTRRIFKSFLSFSLLNSCQLSISPIIHIYLFQFLKILFLQNTKRYIYLYIYINDSSKI